jgi:hypothetical protein
MSRTYRKNKLGKVYQDKDRRKGVLKCDPQCLSHGGCPYCEGNRVFNWLKRKFWSEQEIKEFTNEENLSR